MKNIFFQSTLQKILIIVALIHVSGYSYANDDTPSFVESIEVQMSLAAKSGDYSGVISSFKNTSDEMAKKIAKDAKLRGLLTDYMKNVYSQTDPALNAQLLIQIVRFYPDDFGYAVKYLKSVVETLHFEWAVAVFSNINEKFKISKDIKENEFNAASNALFALASLQISDINLAKRYSENAVNADPRWTGGYFLMSGVYIRQNDHDNAIIYLQKVINLNHHHQGAIELIRKLKDKST